MSRAAAVVVLATLAGLFAVPARAKALPGETLQGWRLVWQDEFEGDALDERSWSRCKRSKADCYDTMSDDPGLLVLEDGVLRLMGIVNENRDEDDASYLSAGIHTKNKHSFECGKIQVRARFKSARGAWPALWMVRDGGRYHGDNYGEIDLMEHLNFDDHVYQTVHSSHTIRNASESDPPKSTKVQIDKDAWNTYGAEWDEEKVVLTVNNEPMHTYPRVAELGPSQFPFAAPFHLIFTMQIGGDWVNSQSPTNPKDYPAWLEVDWVRVYEADES